MEKHRQKRHAVVAAATGGGIQRGSTFDDVVISAMAAKVTHAQSVVLPQRDGGGGESHRSLTLMATSTPAVE